MSTASTSVAISTMNLQQWPSLEGAKTPPMEELDDWEYVSETEETKTNTDLTTYERFTVQLEEGKDTPFIHRCESTPEFSSYSTLGSFQQPSSDDDFSLINDSNSSIAAESILTSNDDTILLSRKPRKVPSFKDMILLNAEKMKEEELKKRELLQKLEQERRRDALLRKKQTKTRLIVTPIKRCARSTGDLRSLTIHEGEEGFGGGGCGGGLSGSSGVIHEDEEVLGFSDAQEYYDRKAHGSSGRAKGKRIRPDEAKRKEMIIHKKNAQRAAQGAKQK